MHLLDTDEETKTKCEDQFKVKMHIMLTMINFEYYANSTKTNPLIGFDHR